jgi:AraC-like DNA-binding protein
MPDGPDAALYVASHDLEEAHEHVTKLYVPHELASLDGQPLDFRLRCFVSDKLTLGQVRLGADTRMFVPSMDSYYHLNLTLRGATVVGQAGAAASTEAGKSGVLFSPSRSYTVRWNSDADQYSIKIPRASLEGQLSALIGRPVLKPIKFNLGFDLTSPRGQSLLSSVSHLGVELAREDGIAQIPLVRAQLESFVLSEMLVVIPNEYQELLITPRDSVRRRHVRAARDFIDEHAMEPITAPDIARAASVSMRALQMGFHDEFGLSPMAYLRNVRLDGAHLDLLGSLGSVSVSEVAMRWGFWHLGRFADQYRRKFGVLPSDTVRVRI